MLSLGNADHKRDGEPMTTEPGRRRLAVFAGVVLTLSACGSGTDGGDNESSEAAGQATSGGLPTQAPTTESTSAPEPTAASAPAPTTGPTVGPITEPTSAPAPEQTVSPITEPPTTPTPRTEPMPAAEPISEGPVEPGRYTHPTIDGLALSVDEPLDVLLSQAHLLLMAGGDMARDSSQGVAFVETLGIIPASDVGVHQPHHPLVPEVTVDLPGDLSVWFDAVPQVSVLESSNLTVAGKPARRWSVAIDPAAGETFSDCGSPHCVGFVVNDGGGVYVLRSDEFINIYQFDALPGAIGWTFGLDDAGGGQAAAYFEMLLAGIDTA